MTASRWAVMGVLLAQASCGLEFTAPLQEGGAQLSVHVAARDSAGTGIARVSAHLSPGLRRDGGPRPVSQPALVVWGQSLLPTDTAEGADLSYESSWSFQPDAFAPLSISVQPPPVAGLADPGQLRAALPWRTAAGQVTIHRGDDLRLTLEAPSDPPMPPPLWENWMFTLTADSLPMLPALQLRTNGTPPPEIAIPAEWLAGLSSGSYVASLSVQQQLQSVTSGVPYRALVYAEAYMRWSVTVVEP